MVLIFDLDDTLYDERAYVLSGLRAVADWAEIRFGWPAARSLNRMRRLLAQHGRGKVFDLWLAAEGALPSRRLVKAAVTVYRHHDPKICLTATHRRMLQQLAKKWPLFLVTDGHKVVQTKKCLALGIAPLFSRLYITHRYGLVAAKPSIRCFDLIRRKAATDWRHMMYIGDNPAKDFVALNEVGAITIRVLTGQHAHDLADKGYDAAHRIRRLADLPRLLDRLSHST